MDLVLKNTPVLLLWWSGVCPRDIDRA